MNIPKNPPLKPGLVSVTFRELAPREIVDLVKKAQLTGIEWGGDIHVPHGDTRRAAEVRRMTADAGLAVAAYGSYYRVAAKAEPDFEKVLESAVALGAPVIRVWAGKKGSADADEAHRQAVAEDSRRICDKAAAAGIRIAYEYHGGTLTDSLDSAVKLIRAVDHPNLRTFWQPRTTENVPGMVREIETLAPWLIQAHVFYWPGGKRVPLSQGEAAWPAYLKALRAAGSVEGALLEFVRDAAPEQFLRDAETLKGWLAANG